MQNIEFLKFLENINIKEFEEFYRSHPNKDVIENYNISHYELNKILLYFNIQKKTKEDTYRLIKKCFAEKSKEEKDKSTKKRLATRENWSEEYKKSVFDKISETKKNKTDEEKQLRLEKFRNTLNNKSKEEKELNRKRKSEATKNYFNNLSDDDRKKFSQKMSEVYANLSDEIKETRKKKISETYKKNCLEKYGVSNAFKVESIKEKIKQTNLEKYGVDYACQLPQCRLAGNNSKLNIYFAELLEKYNIFYEREFHINNLSFDFKVDNNLIEINPTVTHNSTWSPFPNAEKSKDYHYIKSKLARDNGYRCICIWDWDDKEKIISLLFSNRKRIYGRNCEIREVNLDDAKVFIDTYHLQGYAKDNIRIGLYYNNELISIMTFDKPRYNKNYEYELVRYCSSCNIIGGAEKLFKYFKDTYNPSSIISYCDLSKFNGNIYTKLGFIFKNYSIGKHWYNIKTNKHITDNLLRQRGFDQLFGTNFGKGTSNEELMLENGFVEIYDCGQAVYTFLNTLKK